jgi:hypothetical protein
MMITNIVAVVIAFHASSDINHHISTALALGKFLCRCFSKQTKAAKHCLVLLNEPASVVQVELCMAAHAHTSLNNDNSGNQHDGQSSSENMLHMHMHKVHCLEAVHAGGHELQ